MSRQSIMPVIDAIITRIESLAPALYPDLTYSCARDCLGRDSAAEWIENIERRSRDVVVFVDQPPALTVANAPCHIDCGICVAVAYRSDLADDVRDIMMVDDTTQIISAIIARPDLWGDADGVWPRGRPPLPVEVTDADGQTQLYVQLIPLTVWLH